MKQNQTNLHAERYGEKSSIIVMQERGVWKPWQQEATFDPWTRGDGRSVGGPDVLEVGEGERGESAEGGGREVELGGAYKKREKVTPVQCSHTLLTPQRERQVVCLLHTSLHQDKLFPSLHLSHTSPLSADHNMSCPS